MARTGYGLANGTGNPPSGYPRAAAPADAKLYASAQAAIGCPGHDIVLPPPDELGQLGPMPNPQLLRGEGVGSGYNPPPPSPGLLGTLPFSMPPAAPPAWGGLVSGVPAPQQYNPVQAFAAGSLQAVGRPVHHALVSYGLKHRPYADRRR